MTQEVKEYIEKNLQGVESNSLTQYEIVTIKGSFSFEVWNLNKRVQDLIFQVVKEVKQVITLS